MAVFYVDDTDLFSMHHSQYGETMWGQVRQTECNRWCSQPKKVLLVCYRLCLEQLWELGVHPNLWGGCILLPDKTWEGIEQLPVNESRKTIGVYRCPAGDSSGHLQLLEDWAETWLNKIKNWHPLAKWALVSDQIQLWPGLRYGLGILNAPLAQLWDTMTKYAFKVLSHLEVNWHICMGWQEQHPTFGGVGLLSLQMEVTISRIKLFQAHWGRTTNSGISLWSSFLK